MIENQNPYKYISTSEYLNVWRYSEMGLKQISLCMPDVLLKEATKYSKDFGYRNVQDFILAVVREKVILDNVERWKEIETRMKKGKGTTKLTQKQALEFVKSM